MSFAVLIAFCMFLLSFMSIEVRAEVTLERNDSGIFLPWEIVTLGGVLAGMMIAVAIMGWRHLQKVVVNDDFDLLTPSDGQLTDSGEVNPATSARAMPEDADAARRKKSRPSLIGGRLSFGKRG